VENRKKNPLPEEDYKERHHIIPGSLDGDDSKENLVSLSAREHFICHYLLVKMCIREDHIKKMVYALNMMGWNMSGKRYVNSYLYESNKLRFSYQMKNDQERKDKISKTLKTQRLGEGNPMYQRDFSESHRKNISEALKGKPRTQEVRDKISKGHMGISHETSLKSKLQLSKSNEGKKYTMSEEAKRKVSEGKKGKKVRKHGVKKELYKQEKDFVETLLFNKICPETNKNFNPPLKVIRRVFGEENLERIVNELSPD
jgi:hypothetical protein